MAWPIILANIAQPLLGLVDTAVLGHSGTVQDLGAIALGALIFLFVFWSFGFLRMGTTGFVAQAQGAGETAELRAVLARALLLAGVIGLLIVLLQWPIVQLALGLFGASADVEAIAADYYAWRIWGAPAALGLFVVMGGFIGMGASRLLLLVQLWLNGVNMLLDLLFAGWLGWGAAGIGLGTMLAEWSALLLALILLWRCLRAAHADAEPFWPARRVADLRRLWPLLQANADIMIRTLLMLAAFGWFTAQGAAFGDTVLAANHLLLQFMAFSAFFLDGFAFAAESVVGQAAGSGERRRFDTAVRRSTQIAALTALLLATGLLLGGGQLLALLSELTAVNQLAQTYLPWCALYVALSFAAFQLDGIFIGAMRTAAMRNASIFAASSFLLLSLLLMPALQNHGLWLAFNAYVLLRALGLLWFYPALRQAVANKR